MTFFLSPYAAYVWAAYGVSFGGLLLLVLWALNAWHKAKRALKIPSVQDSETNL